MQVRTIDEKFVIAINESVVGPNQLTEPLLLQSAISRQWAEFGGQELFPTLSEKAASVLHGLIQNHPFIDGNKRTGFIAMASLCYLNGYQLDATEDDLVTFTVDIANNVWQFPDIVSRVESFLRPWSDPPE